MMTTGKTVAVGVFTERASAANALGALHRMGFNDEHLGYVTREGAIASTSMQDAKPEGTMPEETNVPTTAAGALSGGVIGGALVAVIALLIPGLGPVLVGGALGGAALGALVGGFAGSLVSLGVTEEEAQYYQSQLTAGRTLVLVSNVSLERYHEAEIIMRQNGAYDTALRNDMPGLDEDKKSAANAEALHASTEGTDAARDEGDIEDEPTTQMQASGAEDEVVTDSQPTTQMDASAIKQAIEAEDQPTVQMKASSAKQATGANDQPSVRPAAAQESREPQPR
jgi:uncharacterized membrane protein